MTWDENTVRRRGIDYPLFITVILLAALGLIMVFSATAVLAQEKFGSSLYFFKKMVLHTSIGFLLLFFLSKVPYFRWRLLVYPILGISLLLMLVTLFSNWGTSVGGARRWLEIAGFRFQPSEFVKIAIILFMAYSLEKKQDKMTLFSVGVLPHLMIGGLLIGFVLLGRDLGTAFVMGVSVVLMLYLGGARVGHLLLLTLATLPFIYHLVSEEGYRWKRILTFLNPWEDRFGAGFQIIQSFLAFNEGGLVGKGLGAGQQKLFYLPEAHTDFIFSVLGEELGVMGVLVTIGLFLFFIFRGTRIAVKAPDLFGRYLALGVVVLIGLQSLFNMGVVLGLLPTKGLVLPFVGYGGSALISTLMGVGILLNISTYQAIKEERRL